MTPHPGARTPDGVRRRTVLRGAAWSVPALLVAAAAPAVAASPSVAATSPGTGCHLDVNPKKQLRAHVTFTGPDGVLVSVTSVTTPGATVSGLPVAGTVSGGVFVAVIALTTQSANDFGPRTLQVSFTVDGTAQPPASVLVPGFASLC